MKLISFIFFHFCCCSLLQATQATVRIGGITNPSTRIGKEQKVAIKLAIENFSTIDSDLLLNTTDLNGTDSLQGSSIIQGLIQWGAKAIITTGTSQQVFVSGTTAIGAKTPVISLMPSSITGPFSFQISYSQGAFVRCIANFVQLHGWPKIITIYEDDALYLASTTNLLLKEALRNIRSNLEYHAVFQPQNSVSDLEWIVEAELRQMMQYESTVYIVLHSSEGLALTLFKKAKELNMTSPRYVWVCGNDITDLLNSTLPPIFIANNMQGVVGIKSYINESVEYQTFYSKFQKMFASDYGKKNENFFNPGVFAVRAYDAVHAVSLASNESKTKNISIAEALSLVNIDGLSGTIVPKNSTPDNNEMKISRYQIFGIFGESYMNLGFWHDNAGFDPGMKDLSWLYGSIGNQDAMKPGGLRTLRVGIPAKPFWDNFVKVNNSNISCSAEVDNSSVTGFCIDVFTKALNFLKYNVSYQYVAYTTDPNQTCNVTTYNDLANLVHSQEVDLVVGDVTIVSSRTKNVSFTQPFITSELVMLIYTTNTVTGWLSTKAFSQPLWICITFILLFYILLVWLLEGNNERADPDFQGPILKQIAASIWLLCNSVFLKIDEGVGSYHTKIVLLWWFLLVQVLLSSFTASLSSIIVNDKLYPNNNNLKVGYNSQSFVLHDYLEYTFNYKPENLVKIGESNGYSEAFKNKTITAAYLELPYVRVLLSEKNRNYAIYGESRTLGGFGFVFPKRSPLRDDLSLAILRLQENGMIIQLQRQYFSTKLVQKKKNTQSELGLANFEYFFLFTTGFAILTALHKCYWPGVKEIVRSCLRPRGDVSIS